MPMVTICLPNVGLLHPWEWGFPVLTWGDYQRLGIRLHPSLHKNITLLHENALLCLPGSVISDRRIAVVAVGCVSVRGAYHGLSGVSFLLF